MHYKARTARKALRGLFLQAGNRGGAFAAAGALAIALGAQAAETLEMDAASGGPTAVVTTTDDQVVRLRRNVDNPAGNTFADTATPVTVTFHLSNQRFPGPDEVAFGIASEGVGPYTPMAVEAGPANQFTSTGVGAATGVGIDPAVNGQVLFMVRSADLAAQSFPLVGRFPMVDLTVSFSRPVDNPVLHLVGLGVGVGNAYTSEFDLLSPGSLTKLSGSVALDVTANQIRNTAAAPDGYGCGGTDGACGSVRVNGLGLTTIRFTVFARAAGTGPWAGWAGDYVGVGVSVDLPPQLTVRSQSHGSVGRFDYTGTNGFADQNIQTNASGMPVAGTVQVMTAGTPTVITQSALQGPALTGVACIDLGSGAAVPATVDLAAATVALDANALGAGAQVECTFTNGIASAAVEPIPTLSQWALVLLSLVIAGFGFRATRTPDR